MKIISLVFFLLFSISAFSADNFSNLENSYDRGTIPNFLPYVGKALHGRCYGTDSNKKVASVLMVSFEEDGFEVAPFDVDKGPEDYLDKMSYKEVLKYFPVIKKMFLWVSEREDNATIEKTMGQNEYRAEIREASKFMVMRVLINDKIIKVCNYSKF